MKLEENWNNVRLGRAALVEVLRKQTSEFSMLREEYDTLKRMLDDDVTVYLAEKKQNSKIDALAIINLHHPGVSSVTMKCLKVYCARECCKLSRSQLQNERRLECRAEIFDSGGPLAAFNTTIAPLPRGPDNIASNIFHAII